MRRIGIAGVVVALTAGAAPAEAVTVSGSPPSPEGGGYTLRIAGGAERNDLSMEPRASGAGVLVRERGSVPAVAEGTCTRRSDSVVVCRGPLVRVVVELGGGTDALVLDLPGHSRLDVDGESGDDEVVVRRGGQNHHTRIRGGKQDDTLRGSSRGDRLIGESGVDLLRAGGGDDVLVGDGEGAKPKHDLLVGGRGHDVASWGDRGKPVRADLRKHTGGTPGDEDELRSIEDLWGGRADDVLVGGAGDNTLRGQVGADRLYGEAGDDRLDGGHNERGSGLTDASVDRLHCGPGDDRVDRVVSVDTKGLDIIPQDCERLYFTGNGLAIPRLELGAQSVSVEVGCPPNQRASRQVTLLSRGKVLGRSELVEYTHGCEGEHIEVPLDQPLAPGPPIRVMVDGEDPDFFGGPPGPSHEYRARYRLSRPNGESAARGRRRGPPPPARAAASRRAR